MVAVYRFVTSMPISGSEGNFWVFGADPSSGGKGKLMTSTLQASMPRATEQPRWLSWRGSAYYASVNTNQSPLNLDAIEQDLADVDAALSRLDADTYFTDEVTGEPLNEEFLRAHPTARRNPAPQ
jgi:hypothetical protein